MTPVLYHYTTPQGLQGIIDTKTIWASDYRFLNDATELKHGLAIFDKLFDSHRERLAKDRVEIIDGLRKSIETSRDFCVFIASFCQNGDLLSQWRGYKAAYALGISGQWLQENAAEQNFELVPIAYSFAQQQASIHAAISLLQNYIDDNAAKGKTNLRKSILRWWSSRMLIVLAALKSEAFDEEAEYRLVKACHYWPKEMRTRPTPQGLVPYVEVKFACKTIDNTLFHPANCGIEEIVIGPGLLDHQLIGLNALLASHSMNLPIKKSSIPFR